MAGKQPWSPQRIGHLAFRICVLVYAALLIVGAWPYHDVAVIGPAASFASVALGRLSIRPGMPVFNAGEPARVEWKVRALCHRVTGIDANDEEELLYDPPCPPVGFGLGMNYFDVVVQRLTRASRERELLVSSREDRPKLSSRSVARFVALGDWFCGAGETGSPRFDRIRFVQQRVFQSYDTGADRVGSTLACSFQCDEEPAPLPRCLQLAPDSELALIEAEST